LSNPTKFWVAVRPVQSVIEIWIAWMYGETTYSA
jgi:hypothetical protein